MANTYTALHPSSERLDSKNNASHVPGSLSLDDASAQDSSEQTFSHLGYAYTGSTPVRQVENLSRSSDLVATVPNVTGSQPYVVDQVAMSALPSSQHADTHVQKDDTRMLHKCPYCNSTSNSKDRGNMNRHIKSVHSDIQFPRLWQGCSHSPKRFDNLLKHINTVHRNRSPEKRCAWVSNERICGDSYPNSKSLMNHVQHTHLSQHLSRKRLSPKKVVYVLHCFSRWDSMKKVHSGLWKGYDSEVVAWRDLRHESSFY